MHSIATVSHLCSSSPSHHVNHIWLLSFHRFAKASMYLVWLFQVIVAGHALRSQGCFSMLDIIFIIFSFMSSQVQSEPCSYAKQ